jgi:glycosyltransferase involved in cell wall biosynthesis
MLKLLRRKPFLSIVMIVYKMPDQAEKTLLSLSPAYQDGVTEKDYEVIVVENDSERNLGAERATRHAKNVRYFHRNETERTPVHAVNFGASQARGTHLAIMIDGARMVTPGVVSHMLRVFRMSSDAIVSTPGYHIGHKLQQVAVNEGYDEKAEEELLRDIRWPENGYKLFEISVLSGSCQSGFFRPNSESNFLGLSVKKWKQVGGMDRRYNAYGGGNANLDLYKRLLDPPGVPFYLLFGEGSFHQFHGGVTTGTPSEERERVYKELTDQDISIRGDDRVPPKAIPILFGQVHPPAYRFIRYSLDKVRSSKKEGM